MTRDGLAATVRMSGPLDDDPDVALEGARALVSRLVAPGAPAAARALVGGSAELELLGQGEDFRVFRAGGLALRVARRPEVAALLGRELRLLGVIAPRLPLAVPRYVAALADLSPLGGPATAPGAGEVLAAAYAFLPGAPLSEVPDPAQVAGLAEELGRFLAALHATPVEGLDLRGGCPDTFDLGLYRDRVREVVAGGAPLPADLLPQVQAYLDPARPLPARAPRTTLVHADLEAEHLLAEPGRPPAVIDWADLGLHDPARDFGALLAWGGPAFFEALLAAYGPPPDPAFRERAWHLARLFAIDDAVAAEDEGQAARDVALDRARRAFAVPLPGDPSP